LESLSSPPERQVFADAEVSKGAVVPNRVNRLDFQFVILLNVANHLPHAYRPGPQIVGSELIHGVIQICNSSELLRLR